MMWYRDTQCNTELEDMGLPIILVAIRFAIHGNHLSYFLCYVIHRSVEISGTYWKPTSTQ